MYDKQVVRRRRATLAVLVGLSIVLLTASFGNGGGVVHGFQAAAQAVLTPIEEGASRAFKPFRDLANWVGDTVHAKGKVDGMKKDLATTRQQLAQSQAAVRENQQLQALVNLQKRPDFPQGTDPIGARIIARSPTVWYSTVQIDVGKSDGVRLNDPVITGDGLVGKVTDVAGGTATVTLITDSSSAVSAEIVPEGSNGVVQPAVGNPDDMELNFVQKGRDVTVGQTVITSGFASGRLESLFPRGIPIGRVKRVDANELELYQRVHIQPFADFKRMDVVQVVRHRGRTPQPNPATAAPGSGGP
ncbi:MAG: rod shape-determining protein MreC [Thermoleophilaceae bacterium]